jgi:uncharacterized membrane protein
MKNKELKLSFGFLIFLLLIPLVNAWGVTTYYEDKSPLVMAPGETKDVYLELQNMDGNKDVTLKAEMAQGSEIATFIDPSREYLVPVGRKDIKVNIRVKIPENAPLDNKYNIVVLFKESPKIEEGKMLQIAGAVGTSIPIVIINLLLENPAPAVVNVKENKIPINSLLAVVIIIIVIIGFIIIFRKKNK